MQEIIRRCDMPVKNRGETAPHGVLVEGEPLRFTVGTESYEIDLCDEHREKFAEAISAFVAGSTVETSPTAKSVRRALKGKRGAFTTKDVRKWLLEQGRDVAPSGRLPNELIDEYRTAHSS